MKRVVHHVITESQNVGLRICWGFDTATVVHLATAYLTKDGLATFESALADQLNRGGKASILIGIRDYVTDPRALRALLRLQDEHPVTPRRGMEVRLAAGFGFHWKLALFGSSTSHAVIIGSSNLTGKGTSSIGEVNLEVRESQSLYRELRKTFEQEFSHGRSLDLDAIREYERLWRRYAALRARLSALRTRGNRVFPNAHRRPSAEVFGAGPHVMCHIASEQEDTKLATAVNRHTRNELSSTRGVTWMFNFTSEDVRRYRFDRTFVLVNSASPRIGFAVCLGKDRFLNSAGRRVWVILYRWRKGLSRRFSTLHELQHFLSKRVRGLGLNRRSIGPALSMRLVKAIGATR